MGALAESLWCNCQKKKELDDTDNKIQDTDDINPKSLIDVKIDSSSFVKKRTGKIESIYDRRSILGNGAFGSVFKVKRKGGDNENIFRALKIINKDQIISKEQNDEIINEINVLRQLDHPNIMKIYEFFDEEKTINIICEFCDSGDLASKMDKYGVFPEFLVKYVMYQVFLGVSFLHENKVFHGDLKRENIAFVSMTDDKEGNIIKKIIENKEIHQELLSASGLINLSEEALQYCRELSNFELKIVDFGSARKKKKENISEKLSGITGTVYYCSPEVVKDKYDFESDEWACGVMMYILLSGIPPFTGSTEEEVFNEVLNLEPKFDIQEFQEISKPCIDLISKLLEKDPSKRIKASEALNSEFFTTGINIGSLLKGKWKENAQILNKLATGKIKTIKKNSKFKDAVIGYICMNFANKNQEKMVKQIFRDLSEGNKKHLITKKTFVSHMKKVCKDFDDEELSDLFNNMDDNNSGNIEYEELMRALSDQEKLLSDKNLKEAFRFFDSDDSGKITWNEIAEIVFKTKNIDKNIVQEFLDEINQKDENMAISFEEFKRIIKE